MSEYPEDIMNTARALAAWVYWGEHDEKEHKGAIAAAIFAERQRCMKIAADAMQDEDPTDEPGDDDWWCRSIANRKAAAIHGRIMKGGAA